MREVVFSCFSLIVALAVWAWLSGMWYSQWMREIFGEVPVSHAGYSVASKLFVRAPYIAAGVVCGATNGIFDGTSLKLVPRLMAPIGFVTVLLVINSNHREYLGSDFAIPYIISCGLWSMLSMVYTCLGKEKAS